MRNLADQINKNYANINLPKISTNPSNITEKINKTTANENDDNANKTIREGGIISERAGVVTGRLLGIFYPSDEVYFWLTAFKYIKLWG